MPGINNKRNKDKHKSLTDHIDNRLAKLFYKKSSFQKNLRPTFACTEAYLFPFAFLYMIGTSVSYVTFKTWRIGTYLQQDLVPEGKRPKF